MRNLASFLLFSLSVSTALAETSKSADWPQWNGVHRDAVSAETGLLQEWPEGGPALAWKATDLGGGDSAPSITNGRIYGMSIRGDEEVVWALSESDGKELWVTNLNPAYEQRMPQSKEGPGGTPTIDGDKMYVMGMAGNVTCLNVADGEIVWQRDLQKDFGGIIPMWSFRESPLVDGDKVIVTPGGKDATLAALDKNTGKTVWSTKPPAEPEQPEAAPPADREEGDRPQGRGRRGPGRGPGGFGGPRPGAAYSSAIIVEDAGKKQYVQLTAKALIGVDAETGELLWQYDRPANRMGINCTSPVFKDGLVFAASAYGNGGGAVKLKKTDGGQIEAEEVYFTSNMQNHHGGLIVVDGCLYGANGGNGGGFLSCLDFQTGEVLWRDRKAPKGSLAMADGRLYLRSEEGPVLLIEPNKEKFVEKGRFDQPDRTSKPAWAHPVIANGKLYIRDQDTLYCYDIKAK